MWNLAARDLGVESYLMKLNVADVLRDVAVEPSHPPKLREIAANMLAFLSKEHCVDEQMECAYVALANSEEPRLEKVGCDGIARCTFGQKRKAAILKQHMVETAVTLLKRHTLESEHSIIALSALRMLWNLSCCPQGQNLIGKKALMTILRIARTAPEETEEGAQALLSCAAILHNAALNPSNRTRMYKSELRVKAHDRVVAMAGMTEDQFLDTYASLSQSQMSLDTERSQPASPHHPPKTPRPLSAFKKRFEHWVDDTFMQPGGPEPTTEPSTGLPNLSAASSVPRLPSFASTSGFGSATLRRSRSLPRETWLRGGINVGHRENEHGERTHLPTVNKHLRQPLEKTWRPHARHKSDLVDGLGPKFGQKRWVPKVRSYQEPDADMKLHGVGEKLLSTERPYSAARRLYTDYEELRVAMGEDHLAPNGDLLLQDRPETAMFTRVDPMSTGKADREHPITIMRKSRAGPSMAGLGATSLEEAAAEEAAVPEPPRRPATAPDSPSKANLKVQVDNIHPRNEIKFEREVGEKAPRLAIFEHLRGSRVHDGYFPEYHVPNGRMCFYYDNGSNLVTEQWVPYEKAPPRPITLGALGRIDLPLCPDLDMLAYPAVDCMPDLRPPARPPPIPIKHTLPFKHPPGYFKDLLEENPVVEVDEEAMLREEELELREEVQYKPPWDIYKSIYAPRLKEADARSFWEERPFWKKMFRADWTRCCSQERFVNMIDREAKKNKGGHTTGKEELAEIGMTIDKHYPLMMRAFKYFSLLGSGGCFTMQLNEYTDFLDTCLIPDPESDKCKRSDCDTLFITANYEEDKKSEVSKVNEDNALLRFEFIEVLIRLALAKYGNGIETYDVSDAVSMLFERNISPNLPPEAAIDSDKFRIERLYFEEMEDEFVKHKDLLRAVYSRYRQRPHGGGLRYKQLTIGGWMQLMDDCKLIDDHFTERLAKLCYLTGQMCVIDEVKNRKKLEEMSWIEFLDAIGRVGELVHLPTDEYLANSGYPNVLDFRISQETETDPAMIMPVRPSNTVAGERTRNLWVKVRILLDYMWRRLDTDPQDPKPFDRARLLKSIKKLDKDMGP